MFEKSQKCHILCNFDQFWDHMTHSKAPYSTKKVHLWADILPKASINLYYQKMDLFLSFLSENALRVSKSRRQGGKIFKILI